MILAVIPCRGGSKRLPRKGLALCAGKPLIVWAVEAALAASTVQFVVVTTDDPEIAATARAVQPSRVLIINRRAELAHDDTPDLPVFQDVLETAPVARLVGFDDLIVHLRPTNPLRRAKDIDDAVTFFRDRWASSLRSVVRVREHPGKMYEYGPPAPGPWGGFVQLRPLIPDMHVPNGPSQSLPLVWRACGFLDIIRAPFIRQGSMAGPLVAAWLVDEQSSIDIDTAEDLAEAERRLLAQKGGKV